MDRKLETRDAASPQARWGPWGAAEGLSHKGDLGGGVVTRKGVSQPVTPEASQDGPGSTNPPSSQRAAAGKTRASNPI